MGGGDSCFKTTATQLLALDDEEMIGDEKKVTSVDPVVHVRNFSEADTQNLVKFLTEYSQWWSEFSESAQTESYFRWKYLRNPFGNSYLGVACDEAEHILGFEGLARWKFLLNENEISCVRGTDLLVHPDHRGRGVASALVSYLNGEAQRAGMQLRFSPLNTSIESRVLKKIGLQQVRNCCVGHVRVRNYVPVLRALLKSKLPKTTPEHPKVRYFEKVPLMPVQSLISHDGFADLLKRDRQRYSRHRLTTRRTIEYVNWRYAEHPTITYHAAAVEENNSLTTAAIFLPVYDRGMKMIELHELFIDREESVLTLLQDLLRNTDADCVTGAWSPGSARHLILRRLGFRPTFGRVHLMVKILNPGMTETVFRPEGWDIAANEVSTWD